MMKKILLTFSLLSLAPALSHSVETAPAPEEKTSLSDSDIDERKKALDQKLKDKIDLINKQFSEMQTLEAKLKDARIELEKKQISARREKLEEFKKKPVADRRVLLNALNYRQGRERQKFHQHQQMERQKLVRKQQYELKHSSQAKKTKKEPEKKK